MFFGAHKRCYTNETLTAVDLRCPLQSAFFRFQKSYYSPYSCWHTATCHIFPSRWINCLIPAIHRHKKFQQGPDNEEGEETLHFCLKYVLKKNAVECVFSCLNHSQCLASSLVLISLFLVSILRTCNFGFHTNDNKKKMMKKKKKFYLELIPTLHHK